MKLLVTGATGFIGSHMCEGLLDRGEEVYGLSRLKDTSKISEFMTHPRFHIVKGDITDFDLLYRLFQENRFQAIFHMAVYQPPQHTDEPFPYFETNVMGVVSILQAAYLAGINRIIVSSSMNVYGRAKYSPVDEKHPTEPSNLYGLTKLMGDMFCQYYAQEFGMKVIILRYSGVFGPRRERGAISNFATMTLAGKPPIIFSNETEQWDTVYVKDVVMVNILALANIDKFKFEIFNIGTGHGVKVADVAEKVIELTGSPVKPKFGNATPSPTFVYDISKAKALLGFNSRPFEQGLAEYIEWEKERVK